MPLLNCLRAAHHSLRIKQTSQILFPSSLFLESDEDAIALKLDQEAGEQ
ncbi:MAG: hypothetical protein V7K27_23055 [Nostoc sp.]